jgi:hypothetical protein
MFSEMLLSDLFRMNRVIRESFVIIFLPCFHSVSYRSIGRCIPRRNIILQSGFYEGGCLLGCCAKEAAARLKPQRLTHRPDVGGSKHL